MTDSESQLASIDEGLRKRFELAWMEGHPQPIEQLLPPDTDARYLDTLEELVHVELEMAWKAWAKTPLAETPLSPARVESYLERFPQLNRSEIVLRLAQQEFRVKRRAGVRVSTQEYAARFPHLPVLASQWEDSLQTVSLAETHPPATAASAAESGGREPASSGPPKCFGNYELLEEIGRGGMGVVYRARQRTANRIVALKVIRRDLLESLSRDTKANTLDRFRHEVQAAARLEHENIVSVYEVGEANGEPFFSMRYVAGRTLAELVRQGPMTNRTAAAYLEPVARAVEEAHRHGILHRDLKPQNILVDAATDRPMVADFGLAKLDFGQSRLQETRDHRDDLTHPGDVMGSPPYVSPEQAQDASRVTFASDVYALGATLYHLLTGRPPFQAASAFETLHQVIEQEPVAPRQLNPGIDRDLETICLKCLQKEPSRRYLSAGALADDLRRYLRAEPIRARPVGAMERTVRWCRRNKLVAALIGSTAAFLLLALAASLIGYVTTSAALSDTEVARGEAEASYRQEREAVDSFFTRVSEDTLLNQPGMQPLRRELLEQVLSYYQRFLSLHGGDPTLGDELALTHFRIGRITEAIGAPEKALDCFRQALDMQQRLLEEQPGDARRLQALGNTHNAVGAVLVRSRKFDDAMQAHEEAIAIRSRLATASPEDAEALRTLANSHMNLGTVFRESRRFEEARRRFDEAQMLRRQLLGRGEDLPLVRRDLAMGCYSLALLETTARDYRAAQQHFEEAISLLEGLLQSGPKDLDNRHRLVTCYRLLADLKGTTRDYRAATDLYHKAIGQQETLARANPQVPEYQAGLAGLYMNLGEVRRRQKAIPEALEALERALRILQPLADEYSGVPEYKRDCAVTHVSLARLDAAAGRRQEARNHLDTAIKQLTELVRQFPKHGDFEARLAEATAALRELPP